MNIKRYMSAGELEQHREEQRKLWEKLGDCPGEISCQFRTATEYRVLRRLTPWQRFLTFDWIIPTPPADILEIVHKKDSCAKTQENSEEKGSR